MDQAQRRVLAIAWPLVASRPASVLRLVALAWAASSLGMLVPWLAKVLIDSGAMAGDMRVLAGTCAAMLLLPLLGLALESWNRFGYVELSSHVLFRLREQVFAHLQTLSQNFYSRVGFGDLAARFDGDLAEVQRFVVDAPLALVGGLFNLALLVGLMVWLHPVLALLVLATLPLQLGATWSRRRGVEAATRRVREQAAALSGYFLDSLRAVKLIQSNNAQAQRAAGLRDHHERYQAALRGSHQAGFVIGALQRISGTFSMALVIGAGGWLLMDGQASVGVLVAFVAYAGRASGPLNTLIGIYSGWQRARVSLGRVGELLGAPTERRAGAAGAPLARHPRGAIEFRRVSFRHESGAEVLRDASFSIAAGSKVALLGASGAGKSTLCDLLRGHFAPHAGAILIDGLDIAGIDLASLRSCVAVVDQEPVFLPGTVADNLRQVRPGAGDAELLFALRRAGIAIGLERSLGAASALLSRGERLRLALARAILRAPSILVLDETTSGVEREVALAVMASVDRVFAGCTRIVITHDLALAGTVDAVCVLRGRRVVQWRGEAAHAG